MVSNLNYVCIMGNAYLGKKEQKLFCRLSVKINYKEMFKLFHRAVNVIALAARRHREDALKCVL